MNHAALKIWNLDFARVLTLALFQCNYSNTVKTCTKRAMTEYFVSGCVNFKDSG